MTRPTVAEDGYPPLPTTGPDAAEIVRISRDARDDGYFEGLADGHVRVGTLDDSERCHRCGGENVNWCAPSPLWNLVMRGNDIDGDPLFDDLVCPRCFIVIAAEQGWSNGQWRLSLWPEPWGLVYTTPTGRTWNPETWLWDEADAEDGYPPLPTTGGGDLIGVQRFLNTPERIRRARKILGIADPHDIAVALSVHFTGEDRFADNYMPAAEAAVVALGAAPQTEETP